MVLLSKLHHKTLAHREKYSSHTDSTSPMPVEKLYLDDALRKAEG